MSVGAGKLGFTGVLQLNGGTYGSPTFTSCGFFSDLALKAPWDTTDASSRASGVKMEMATMMALSVTGKMRSSNSGDTNYQAIIAALIAKTVINIQILNGAPTTTGVWGFMYDCQVKSVEEDLGLGVAVYDGVEFTPYPSGNSPQYALVSSGSASYTTM